MKRPFCGQGRRRRGKKVKGAWQPRRWAVMLDDDGLIFPDVYEEYWRGMTFWV